MIVCFQQKHVYQNMKPTKAKYLYLSYRIDCAKVSEGLPGSSVVKNLPANARDQEMWETRVGSLDREYPLEKEMATHFSILA